MKSAYRIEKAHGSRMKWAIVDTQGNVVKNFVTRDEARKFLNRAPAKKLPYQPAHDGGIYT